MRYIYRYDRPGHDDDGSMFSEAEDITAAIGANAGDNMDRRYYVFVATDPDTDPLDKSHAVARTNWQAGVKRRGFRTDEFGQEETYRIKVDEATAFRVVVIGGGTPVAADYPMIQAEAQATSMTMGAVAAAILQEAVAWKQHLIAIEAARRGALVRIAAATTYAEVQAVFPIIWP